jgi:hypothetical protein
MVFCYPSQIPHSKGFCMNRSLLVLALFSALGLAACDKPTVINVPAAPVGIPGPAGPQGTTGTQGKQGVEGNKGEAGKPADGPAVIILPPSEPAK